jgi:hypothetical protein
VKTFLESTPINESREGMEAMKVLNRVHKLELEIQDIQRSVVELFDKAGKYQIGSKERTKIESRVQKFMEERDEILKEMEYEKMNLRRALTLVDTEGDLDKFFE